MTASLPSQAEVVVIGGGIIGCSTAYHLARDHKADVVLIERGKLTGGSTWHAAGLVGQLRSSAAITQVLRYSVDLYKRLEAETGLATGWRETGCLRLACNGRALDRVPPSGDHRALLRPRHAPAVAGRGQGDVAADRGRRSGRRHLHADRRPGQPVRHHPGAGAGRAHAWRQDRRRRRLHRLRGRRMAASTGVRTSAGRHRAATRSCSAPACGRARSPRMAGVSVPLQAVKHQYVITEQIAGIAAGMATVRDPDRRTYFKEEVGGLVFGGYEPNPVAWVPTATALPDDFAFRLLDDDWDHFEQHMEAALARIPALETAGIKQMINGPESFTPDGNFILGEAPELRELLRRRRFQRLRHRLGRRRRLGAGRVGVRRRAADGSVGRRHPPLLRAAQGPRAGPASARSRPTASTTPSPFRSRNTRAAGRASSRRSTSG